MFFYYMIYDDEGLDGTNPDTTSYDPASGQSQTPGRGDFNA